MCQVRPPSLTLRVHLVWRVLAVATAVSGVGAVLTQGAVRAPTAAITVALAVWVWAQRIEVVGTKAVSRYKPFRGSVDLSDLQRLEVRRDATRGLYRVVLLQDSQSTLTFMLIGWDNWRDLVRRVFDHAIARDDQGTERWLVETDGDVDRLRQAV